jgi:hypothetical protein
MKVYTTEVEFLRDEVEKCHASMHSQIETVNVLMLANIELRSKFDQKRQWQTLDDAEYQEILAKLGDGGLLAFYILIEAKLKEKNA